MQMSTEILKRSDLDLKSCLELFKTSPFTLKYFLEIRGNCLIDHLSKIGNDYLAIVTVIIREMFCDTLRQAFTIFTDKSDEKEIFYFANQILFKIVMDLRILLKESHWDRPQLTHLWHTTVLAGEALRPFSADFSPLLDAMFIDKMFQLIKSELDEHLNSLEVIEFEGKIEDEGRYALNTTIALNSVVDAINQVKLCPENVCLREKVRVELQNHPKLTENIKLWSKAQL